MAKKLANNAAKPKKPLPEELAKDAMAHEEEVQGGKVRLTVKVDLPKPLAEALSAEAIRREMNLPALITELLEIAAAKAAESRSP